jgi:hypothetical protein
MKSSRFALLAFAALVGIGTLAGSAQYSPAAARGFGPDYGWMGNQKYMACIKYVGAYGADYPDGTRISGLASGNTFRAAADCGGLKLKRRDCFAPRPIAERGASGPPPQSRILTVILSP